MLTGLLAALDWNKSQGVSMDDGVQSMTGKNLKALPAKSCCRVTDMARTVSDSCSKGC
jgi:hypothetical protein